MKIKMNGFKIIILIFYWVIILSQFTLTDEIFVNISSLNNDILNNLGENEGKKNLDPLKIKEDPIFFGEKNKSKKNSLEIMNDINLKKEAENFNTSEIFAMISYYIITILILIITILFINQKI